MLTRYAYKNLRWVDIDSPSRGEVKELMREFGLHPRIADELLIPTPKPKLAPENDFIFLVLHFPALKQTHASNQVQEIDFIIAKNFLITAHYDTVDTIHKFSKEFEVSALIDKSLVTKHAGYLFSHLIKRMYLSLGNELEFLGRSLLDIEENIFEGHEKEMVHAISEVSRSLLKIKRTIHDHGDTLTSLEEYGKKFFGLPFVDELRSINRQYKIILKTIEHQIEALNELRDTNNSLLSTKENEIMKVLTIMAFVTFPLTLIAAIADMQTTTKPLTGYPGDFWVIVLLMMILAGGFFAFFKYKNWL